VVNAKTEISQILLENLQVAGKAVSVYAEYLFILTEPQKVQDFMEGAPRDKAAYIERIQVYLDTIEKIKREAPYEIRMSMFLIQCHELNNRLILECERLVETIVKKIYDDNLDEATMVITDVKMIGEDFNKKAEESHEWVAYEAVLQEVQSKKRGEIITRYNNLIEWLELMYSYPRFEPNDEIQK
jgi:vancomycin resistance protein YoaR